MFESHRDRAAAQQLQTPERGGNARRRAEGGGGALRVAWVRLEALSAAPGGRVVCESEESSATDGERRRRGSDEKLSEREGSLVPPEQVRSAWGSKLVLLTLWGVAGIAMQGVE